MKDGRRFGARPNPYVAPEVPPGKINVTDLDSRNVKTPRSYTQGYNAQAVVNEHQIVLAAEVTLTSPDFGHLEPMIKATRRELAQIGVSDTPGVAVADSGYWHEDQIDQVVNMGTQVLIPPDAGNATHPAAAGIAGATPSCAPARRDPGGGHYRRRKAIVEPMFAQTKHNRRSTSSSGEQIRRTLGVATDHRDSQPNEAPQAPPGRPGDLKRHLGRTDTPTRRTGTRSPRTPPSRCRRSPVPGDFAQHRTNSECAGSGGADARNPRTKPARASRRVGLPQIVHWERNN